MFYVYLVPGLVMLKFFLVCLGILVISSAIAAIIAEGVKKVWSRLS